MCGITGILDYNNSIDKKQLKQMRDLLIHRGPDDKGIFIDNNKHCSIGLAHRRLSIIDLSKDASQPMCNENNTIHLIYNGEIYNFKQLMEDLKSKGHIFKSNSDTEVIIHAYEEYGINCLSLFNGMFAFALWDSEKSQLFITRDRLGIKPLYYYWDNSKLMFASEMKALTPFISKSINKNTISAFLSNLCIPAPYTILNNIFKLLPGEYITVKDKKISKHTYWDINFKEINLELNTAKKLLVNNLKEAVQKRLIADVPLGAFLSGGIDSSSIVALMSKCSDNVKTFSIGFEGINDELDIARQTSEMHSTDHKEFVVKPADFSLFPKLVYHADEPFADDSIIPTFIVSELARKHVTVCLSGDGGDENFAGYDRYAKNIVESYYCKTPQFIRNRFAHIQNKRFARIASICRQDNNIKRFIEGNSKFIKSEQDKILTFKPSQNYYPQTNSSHLNQLLYADFKTTLPNLFLKKTDTASMANSLEVRTPFLDHEFVSFAATLPSHFKLNHFKSKFILKQAMKPYLPKAVFKNKKQGFSAPVDKWLRGPLKHELNDIILSSTKRGFFDKDFIKKLILQHNRHTVNHQQRLWALVSFELWNRIFIDEISYKQILK